MLDANGQAHTPQEDSSQPANEESQQGSGDKGPLEVRSILKPSRPDGQPQRDLQNGKAISWVDLHGKELAVVHEFEASDSEYSDEADNGQAEGKSCCTIS